MTSASSPLTNVHKRTGYTGALLTTAALAGLAGLLVIMFTMRSELSGLLPNLSQDPTIALTHTRLLEKIIAGPALCAAMGALLLWRAIWVVRVTRYMRFTRAFCRDRLRRDAPLMALGIAPTGHPRRAASDATASPSRPITGLLDATPHALLLGAVGSGKSTALLAYGQMLSSRSLLSRIVFGVRREPLPVLAPLPALVSTLRESQLALPLATTSYIASLLARLGTNGLGARAEALLKAGRVTLLCDDYDKLDDDEREIINQALQALRAAHKSCRIVVACESAAYAAMIDDLGPLAHFDAIELAPLPANDLSRALKKWQSSQRRGKRQAELFASLANLAHRPIATSLGTASVAAALIESAPAGKDVAWGRAELLRASLLTSSASTTSRNVNATENEPDAGASHVIWAALAASFQDALRTFAPLDATRTIGENMQEWLTNHPPPGPTDFALSATPELAIDSIERAIQAGLRCGVLQRSLDGVALSFSDTLTQVSAAALWLELRDDGLGRLNTQLLRLRWALPVALWTGSQAEPHDLAQRIFRFANSPSSIAPRAGMADSLDVYPQTLALALAALLEGAAPKLARMVAQQETSAHGFLLTQQGLRDLLDPCVVYGAELARRPRLTRALGRVQQEVGVEFVAYLGALAREVSLDRLLRAQLTITLGLTATPEAMNELMSLLMQSDPTMRQAVEQALQYAGVSAIPALQAAVRSGSGQTRQRAEEALRTLSGGATAATVATGAAAIANLNSPDAGQRRVAVTTLSAIGASEALNDLIARLDDVNIEVRLAAASALGQLGGKRALLALRRHATNEDTRMRHAVAQALGVDPEPASVPSLLRLIKDRDASVRAAAAVSLGVIADKRAIGALREAAEDTDPWVRHAAQTAARRYTHP